MRIYDVTLTISPELVVWPEDPPVQLYRTSQISSGDISNVSHINMSAHTGTHIDAPCHFIEGGETVEDVPIDLLIGRVYLLHLPHAEHITLDMVKDSPIPPRTKRVLFRTRNSDQWQQNINDFDQNYVGLTPEAAEYLVARGVKLIGVDYLSVAPFNDVVTTHQVLLRSGVVVVEGLDLSRVPQGRYTLYCMPLKLRGADGAPARAILIGV